MSVMKNMVKKSIQAAFVIWLASFFGMPGRMALGNEQRDVAERNIVLFVTDDQGTQIGCYGDTVAATPAMDALANDGLRFTRAFANTASCSPSRATILSGLQPHAHGQYGLAHNFHKFSAYHDVVRLALPQLLSNAGYRTARCGKFHIAPEGAFHFEQTIPANSRSPVEMADHCREFLTDHSSGKPFFLYFATSDPHRGGGVDETSELEFKPDLFGNKPDRAAYPGIEEVFFDPADVVVPDFLPDTPETRAELAQYYQSVARIDQGLKHLVEILKEAGVYDKTLIVFTSDHGIAFAGAKTTVYEPGLQVPLIVRNPYASTRGKTCDSIVSHIDITPTLLDFAGQLDKAGDRPSNPINANQFWKERDEAVAENRRGPNKFDRYHGRSWLSLTEDPSQPHHEFHFASHTFHEIQMYYPMRAYRDERYKLIWNVASPLDFPFAADLWAAASWQGQWQHGLSAAYGFRTIDSYIHRPRFELFDLQQDPNETRNLAEDPQFADLLKSYQAKLKQAQQDQHDPWISKWRYE
ncbi:MAG: sulfatase [Pirellulaceae bacterium]